MYSRTSLAGPKQPLRPKRVVIPKNTAFIRKKSREKSATPPPIDEKNVKIPSYLTLLLNLIYFPATFVYKIYSAVVYIISVPGRVIETIKYLFTLPPIVLEKLSKVPASLLTWTCRNLEGLLQLCSDYQIGGILCLFLVFWFLPIQNMTYPLFAILRLVLGTLYPAYASFKAVRTKNVREYVKWMMYWIVFAIFSSLETFADIFVAFWFPFYYEVKILLLIWLISPVSKGSLGSSIIYRRFVHPNLIMREDEIDRMIQRLQEQGYNTVTKLAVRAFNYVSNMVMQTAIRAPELMNEMVIEAQRLQQQQNSMDTTDSADNRFVEVMETEEFNQDSFEAETENVMAETVEVAAPAKKPEKKARKGRKSSKNAKKAAKSEIMLSSDSEVEDVVTKNDPDYKPARRTRSSSKKQA